MTYKDPLVTWMRNHNIPVTRDRYIGLNWPDGEPDPWTPEDEAQLPEELQIGGQGYIGEPPLAVHAARINADEGKRIEEEIRTGAVEGRSPEEIAKRVVGTSRSHGIDGQTETTRQKIGRLGAALLKRKG